MAEVAMTPQEIFELAREAGLPPWLAATLALLGVGGAAIAVFWSKRRQSRGALLSADQQSFQERLMKMVKDGDDRITRLTNDLAECNRNHGKCLGDVSALSGRVDMLELQLRRLADGHD